MTPARENFLWLVADKILRVGLTALVGFWMARHLGPASFGALSYAAATVAFLVPVADLGIEMLVRRDLTQAPERAGELAATVMILRLTSGGVAMAVLWLSLPQGWIPASEIQLIMVLSFTLFAPGLNVTELWLQSRLEARQAMPAQWLALAVGTAGRVVAIIQDAPLVAFVVVMTVETLLAAIFVTLVGRRRSLRFAAFDRTTAIALLRETWPLTLLGVMTVIYMRIDVMMLRQWRGEAEAGVYAAATRLVELTYMIPSALALSVMPALLRAKEEGWEPYMRRLGQYMDASAAAAYFIIIPVSVLAPLLIQFLYGAEYAGAAKVLRIQIWGALFVFLGIARGQFLINAGLTRFYLAAATSGAVVNVALNLVLIPRWGATGAAIAMVTSYAMAAWLSSYFSAAVWPVARAQTGALFIFVTGFKRFWKP